MIEIPPKFAGRPPVNPAAVTRSVSEGPAADSRAPRLRVGLLFEREWKGAAGLAEDVRYYGQWMRDEAFKRIGHLYPPIEITKEMVRKRPDLKPYEGEKLTVIAWLWARTVCSPNPAFRHVEVPLASTFILSSKEGKEAYVAPVLCNPTRQRGPAEDSLANASGYKFTVKVGKPPAEAKAGTTAGKRSAFICLMSNVPMSYDYIREEGRAGRMGQKLMAIVAEGARGRVYLSPTPEQEALAATATPEWKPDLKLPDNPRDFKTPNYGMMTFGDLFTPRQLVALTRFSDLVNEARERIRRDAVAAGLPDDDTPLDTAGTGARAYAEAVSVYLGMGVSKLTDYSSVLVVWSPTRDQLKTTFSRQALPMAWDFSETNPFAEAAGDLTVSLGGICRTVNALGGRDAGSAAQSVSQSQTITQGNFVSTDPPYYDNIGYADLSDFFYVWLRRSLRSVYPNLLATIAVPKAEELVATPYRHGTKDKAEKFFLDGMTKAMHNLAVQAHPAAPITIYYAFKQSETESTEGTSSSGWETFLDAVLKSGLAITGTWPMRTERAERSVSLGTNSLASSIILVCRPRAKDAGTIDRRKFQRQLNEALPLALDAMTRGFEDDHHVNPTRQRGIPSAPPPASDPSLTLRVTNGMVATSPVAPVDLSQAIIGPGMAIFSRYDAVLEADGTPMTVKTALQLINRFLAEDDFDADTQFCLHWFEQHHWDAGRFGEADTLARAKGTSVEGVKQSGVLYAAGGNVRLFKWAEYPTDWIPADDGRLPVWEALHQLIRVFSDALNRLADRLHYLNSSGDKAQDATRFWFDTRANLRREMEDRKRRFENKPEVRAKISEVLKKLVGSATFFDGVHIFTPHSDIPDDSALRLVVLSPDHCHSKEFEQAAIPAVLEHVRQNGTKPRYRGNRLLFLAPDMAVLSRLRDATHVALAWGSIVDDVKEGRLNIDLLQKKQAEKELQTAEDVLPRAARECYKWLLCPMQNAPTDPKPAVEPFPLATTGSSVGKEIERVCIDNELVISTWSPIHLRARLKELYWKDGKVAASAMTFWEDTLRYLYLPRLKNRDVLAQAIRTGAASRDFFGTAYGQTDDKFDGFRLGDGNVQFDDTLLLIEPQAAEEYEKAHPPGGGPGPGPGTSAGTGTGGIGTGPGTGTTTGTGTGVGTGGTAVVTAKARSFHGTAEVPASTAKMRLVQLADEIITLLCSDPNADVNVTLEVSADFPEGASDQMKRAVSENATALGFKSKAWE